MRTNTPEPTSRAKRGGCRAVAGGDTYVTDPRPCAAIVDRLTCGDRVRTGTGTGTGTVAIA